MLPIQYAQPSTCLDCHQDKYKLWQQGSHNTVNCENCHGPARPHLETREHLVVDTSRELCGTCHARLISRPAGFPQVNMEEMGEQAECTTCHDAHTPRAGMPPQVPHALAGHIECQSCHNPQEPLTVIPPPMPHTLEGHSDCLSCHGPQELRGVTLPRIPHSLERRSDCLVCHSNGGTLALPEDHSGRTSATCLNCHRSKL